MNPLRTLFADLRSCPAQSEVFSETLLRQAWEQFKERDWPPEDRELPALLAALVLHDRRFAPLLTEPERSQLRSLAKTALERFEHKAYPPNHLGKILASSLKEL